ncbi:hypothetical protein MPC4_20100 [Methylocella tundrae]|uniref:Uncharacterized protein n=1 Tax=Methylocella tundrae TaxID=227605 RepID=A0A8B6M6E6_METTU|nr:hypothetical protein MPC1_9370003 [Methylocella tundrae]VTZ49890.1 hypothetical protein MPC4_20100 [Methylocella tundrae]
MRGGFPKFSKAPQGAIIRRRGAILTDGAATVVAKNGFGVKAGCAARQGQSVLVLSHSPLTRCVAAVIFDTVL